MRDERKEKKRESDYTDGTSSPDPVPTGLSEVEHIGELRAYLEAPESNEERAQRFKQVAEARGISVEQLEMDLAIMPLTLEPPLIHCVTPTPPRLVDRLVRLSKPDDDRTFGELPDFLKPQDN